MIARADKGKITVIIYTKDYTDKVHTFFSENNFRTLTYNPTHKDHKTIHKTLPKWYKIIDKKLIKYLTQNSPSPLTLNALLKLHKLNIPIRPVVNNRTAPAYKAAKKLNTILSNHLHIENQYVSNSNTLPKDLIQLKINNKQDC
jgi:hypothetical protein